MNRRWSILLGVLIVAGVLIAGFWRSYELGAQKNNGIGGVELDSGTIIALGTLGHIKVIADDEVSGLRALQLAREELKRMDKLVSTYRSDSELARVNRFAWQKPVRVSPEVFELLEKAQMYSGLSGGAFDITVTPLIKLWKKAGKENRLPDKSEIERAKKYVGYEKVILDKKSRTVRFAPKGVELNVDAIAKGYIVDKMVEAIRKVKGIRAGLVEIGGEVGCFGRDWIIGIENPFVVGNGREVSWRIKVRDGGVATSGNYRRYVQIGAKRYSHIIDPRTGWPADKLPGVTVIAKTVADADALATAVSVMGVKKGLALINSLDGTKAFIVAGGKENMRIYRAKVKIQNYK